MGEDRIKIRVGINVHHAANATYEDVIEGPTRAEWDAMSGKERDEYLEDTAEVVLSNQISYYANVVED